MGKGKDWQDKAGETLREGWLEPDSKSKRGVEKKVGGCDVGE